ncbi:DUF2474 domain-containing protein [Aurantimonas sp. A2-1-M11]|uniref:DUF2474 domain-containing protein n=1 Tax=Aurantimonas sp. A2-1-M11 TaxID=3113712 RepID=UPI002F9402D6
MKTPQDGRPDADRETPGSLKGRIGWFILLWLGGVAAVTAVGYAIRLVLIG